MKVQEDKDIQNTKARLIEAMTEFMGEGIPYDQSHVDRCDTILNHYLNEVNGVSNRDELFKATEVAVEALNELDEDAECVMIETDQREDICAIITRAGYLTGFCDQDEDITEDWREW